MIDIGEIEGHIAAASCVVTDIEPTGSSDIPSILYGILHAMLAQAKVQLLAVQQAAEDRAMRMEQMEIGKSMMGMFGGMGGANRGESEDGREQFRVRLSTGEDVVVLARNASEAMSIAEERLKGLGLDPSVVSDATPVDEL